MSLGNEMPYRRSQRGPEATGSLVFDQERRRIKDQAEAPQPDKTGDPDFRKAQAG